MANDAQSPSFMADGAKDCRFKKEKKKSIFRQKSLSDLTPFVFTVREAASCSATRKKKLQWSRTGRVGVERAGHCVCI